MSDWQPSQLQLDRQAYRRSRTRRSALFASLSTLVVLGAIALTAVNSPGWTEFRNSFLDLRAGWHDFPALLSKLWINVQIMLISEVVVLIFGTLLAVARTLQGPVFFPLRLLSTVYTDIFRGVPVLIVIYVVVYGLPSLRLSWLPSSEIVLCCIALSITYSAYVAEDFRAGIQSVHPSQRAAARSLGLSHGKAMRYVVFPQAVRLVLPPLLNDFVSLQKDTALVSTVGVIEVTLTAQNASSIDFKFVYYLFAGLIFLALTVPLTRLTDWIAAKQGWTGVGGGVV